MSRGALWLCLAIGACGETPQAEDASGLPLHVADLPVADPLQDAAFAF